MASFQLAQQHSECEPTIVEQYYNVLLLTYLPDSLFDLGDT